MRLYATATITALCVTLLCACANPPGEIDSDRRIDTAHDVAAPTTTKKTETSTASKTGASSPIDTSTPATSTTIPATTSGVTSGTTSMMVHASRGIPGVIDCVGSPTKRPETLSLSCSHTGDKLKNITWETWNETGAKGTAIRETRVCGGKVCKDKDAKGQTTETEVKVELSAPTMTSQGPAFTLITVNGASIVL